MMSTNGGAFARLVAGGAAAATALAGFTIGLAAPAHAAVTISGSTVDAAGNYVDGRISVYKFSDEDGDGTVEEFEYDFEPSVYTQAGAFDLNLEDGLYKLEFEPDFGSAVPVGVLPRQGRPRDRGLHHRRRCRAGPPGLDHRRDPHRDRHGRHDRRPPGAQRYRAGLRRR